MEQLATDLVEIVTVFSSRLYGMRSHQNRKSRNAQVAQLTWLLCEAPDERAFVISHECLHLMLDHGQRISELAGSDVGSRRIAGIAADLVVNHMAEKGFGFDVDNMPTLGPTILRLQDAKDRFGIELPVGKSLESYYALLRETQPEEEEPESNTITSGGGQGNGSDDGADHEEGEQEPREQDAGEKQEEPNNTLDDHSGFTDITKKALEAISESVMKELAKFDMESFVEQLQESEANEEIKSVSKGSMAGSIAGNMVLQVRTSKVQRKRKWESVIRRWCEFKIRENDRHEEQWARMNRRFTALEGNLFLPSEMEVEGREKEKNRIKVVFFQDTSRSCVDLAERFFRAAKSLPSDRFDVDMYCFDTRVYKTSLETGKLYGFGGTSFGILESEVQNIAAKTRRHPAAVFVITDGYGDRVSPKKPEAWHWFLSSNYTDYIDKRCHIHKLADFE